MRASEDGASTAPPCYAACNAPAAQSDGALPMHCTSALGTHPVAAALKRALPCERLVSGSTPNEITSGLRMSRSEFSLVRLRKRDVVLKQHSLGVFVRLFQKSFHRVQARPHKRPFTDALIQMRCAKKPLPQKGAYYCVRDRIAEGALTKQVAE